MNVRQQEWPMMTIFWRPISESNHSATSQSCPKVFCLSEQELTICTEMLDERTHLIRIPVNASGPSSFLRSTPVHDDAADRVLIQLTTLYIAFSSNLQPPTRLLEFTCEKRDVFRLHHPITQTSYEDDAFEGYLITCREVRKLSSG
jgi:hypothetical protein